jgi:hypothetical protein
VLAGVGGKTVEELNERMSQAELVRWMVYAEENGPISPILRNDLAVARLCAMFGSGKVKDYMPWPKAPEPEPTFEQAVAIIKTASKSKRSK